MPFRDYLQKLAPTSLRRKWGGLWLKGVGEAFDGSPDGVVKDDSGTAMTTHVDANGLQQSGAPAPDYGVSERVKAAVKARFPDQEVPDPMNPGQMMSVVPTDALHATASERLLEPGLLSSLNLGIRLRQAWSTWIFGGTAYGLLRELWALGYQNVHLVVVNGFEYTMQSNTGAPGDGTVGLAGSGDLVIRPLMAKSYWPSPQDQVPRRWWTSFAVVFDAPLPNLGTAPPAPSNWNSALPASGSNEVNAIRRVIARWKPGFAICDRIVVLTSGNTWGWPKTLKWGAVGLKWGGNTVTYWSP